MTNIPMNQTENIYAMSPTYDFRATVDVTRHTKAIYMVLSTNVAATVPNSITAGNITVRVGGQFYPLRVKAAVTIAGYDVIYCY